jgi:predicted nucleic acid-binding protein/antitoxin component of MazEF toxin-antitoxin module
MSQAVIGKWGKNLAVRVPQTIARACGLSEGEPVDVVAQDGDIVIRRSHARSRARPSRRGRGRDYGRQRAAQPRRNFDPGIDRGRPPRVSIVLDASMAVAWLFKNKRTEDAHRVLRRVVDEGAFVPSLWHLEVANILRNAVRRGRCTERYVDKSLARLSRLTIAVDAETDARAWRTTLKLSREEDLTLYDASYLELALRVNMPLASCDGDLIEAAKRRQIGVLTA